MTRKKELENAAEKSILTINITAEEEGNYEQGQDRYFASGSLDHLEGFPLYTSGFAILRRTQGGLL